MNGATDECQVEEMCSGHAIAAELFVPFVIERLRPYAEGNATRLEVTLRDIHESGDAQRILRVSWLEGSVSRQPLGVQEHTVTEWAALGLACGLAAFYGKLQVVAVSVPGDRFDYWVTDGKTRLGLEVSGTIAEDMTDRHREKLVQLQENPYRVDGYISVVSFAARKVVFSFHRYAENAS